MSKRKGMLPFVSAPLALLLFVRIWYRFTIISQISDKFVLGYLISPMLELFVKMFRPLVSHTRSIASLSSLVREV